MKDKFFVDSNIVLYLIDDINKEKREIALSIVNQFPILSPQVIFETINVCLRKYKIDKATTLSFINFLLTTTILQSENEEVVKSALLLYNKYSLQPFDSKIIASALAAGCSVLYSEDMQNGLVIDDRLTIVNPFL
jgi:predicted nucleic acid-binding protein